MGIQVFLSYPKPAFDNQRKFIEMLMSQLTERGMTPRTLGVTDYDMDAPLTCIRRLMAESNGIITIALRRTYIESGTARHRTDISHLEEQSINNKWLTTPWPHIESAMAYQIGLPILVLRESGVIDDGVLEKGVVGLYMPEFMLDNEPNVYLKTPEWAAILGKWESRVRQVVQSKGHPPQMWQ